MALAQVAIQALDGQTPVAVSECEFLFGSRDDLDRCVAMLNQSGAFAVPTESRPYHWNKVSTVQTAEGWVIRFTITWFSVIYFGDHRSDFVSEGHLRMYEALGVDTDKIKVVHRPTVEA